MVVTKEERATFGWLGVVPPEIVSGSPSIVRAYKKLSSDAKRVAYMKRGGDKVAAAHRIEQQYYWLISQAKGGFDV